VSAEFRLRSLFPRISISQWGREGEKFISMGELERKFPQPNDLLSEIRIVIAEARRQAAVTVNVALTLLYWRIGQRIYVEVLGSDRAAYGDQIVPHCRDNW
jgi:hypothetical protein